MMAAKLNQNFYLNWFLSMGPYSPHYITQSLALTKYLHSTTTKWSPASLGEQRLLRALQSAPQVAIIASGFLVVNAWVKGRGTTTGPFSFRKELADQAENELKGFVPRGVSLSRHAPMTQNPLVEADTHDTTAASAHRSFL